MLEYEGKILEEAGACVIIPARFESSRFPGKPLAKISGREMILRVCDRSAVAVGRHHVYVATDDQRIASLVKSAGYNVLITGDALTGTDRVAEAAAKLQYTYFINVQGDEPLLEPEDIVKCLKVKKEYPSCVVNGYANMSDDETPSDTAIPKVVFDGQENLLYISRAPIPSSKTGELVEYTYKKQVCIYVFLAEELNMFRLLGSKGAIERHEDIEILRFLESGKTVKMVKCSEKTIAVDFPSDVARVEAALEVGQ